MKLLSLPSLFLCFTLLLLSSLYLPFCSLEDLLPLHHSMSLESQTGWIVLYMSNRFSWQDQRKRREGLEQSCPRNQCILKWGMDGRMDGQSLGWPLVVDFEGRINDWYSDLHDTYPSLGCEILLSMLTPRHASSSSHAINPARIAMACLRFDVMKTMEWRAAPHCM